VIHIQAVCDARSRLGLADALVWVGMVIRPMQRTIPTLNAPMLTSAAALHPQSAVCTGVLNILAQMVALVPARVALTGSVELADSHDSGLATVTVAQPVSTHALARSECAIPSAG